MRLRNQARIVDPHLAIGVCFSDFTVIVKVIVIGGREEVVYIRLAEIIMETVHHPAQYHFVDKGILRRENPRRREQATRTKPFKSLLALLAQRFVKDDFPQRSAGSLERSRANVLRHDACESLMKKQRQVIEVGQNLIFWFSAGKLIGIRRGFLHQRSAGDVGSIDGSDSSDFIGHRISI